MDLQDFDGVEICAGTKIVRSKGTRDLAKNKGSVWHRDLVFDLIAEQDLQIVL